MEIKDLFVLNILFITQLASSRWKRLGDIQ